MSDVFISYVEEDSAVAAEAARVLRDGGLTSWRYEADSVGGQNYLLQTRTEIEVCRAFLIVLSPASMASEQVDREVVRAHECGKPFVPVLRDLTYADFARRRPGWQQAMGAATALTVPEDGLAEIGARLVAGVRAAAGAGLTEARRATPPPPAKQRLARVLRSRRTRRIAWLVLALGLGTGFAIHAWGLRREAEDRKAAAEAKLEAIRLLDTWQQGAALPVLERALALTPQDGEIQLLLGRLRYQNLEPKLALEHLDRRLHETPNDALARYWRGRAHEALDNLDASIEDLSVAIASGSLPMTLSEAAFRARGTALLDRSTPDDPVRMLLTEAQRRDALDAEADFTSLMSSPDPTDALLQRGRARARLAKDNDALEDLSRAYNRCKDSAKEEDLLTVARASYYSGLIALRRSIGEGGALDASRAAELFDVSLQAKPDFTPAKVMRAFSEGPMGHNTTGTKMLENLLAGLSADNPSRPLISSCLEQMRKATAALPVRDLVTRSEEVQGPDGAGVEVRVTCSIRGRKGIPCRAVLRVFDGMGSPYFSRWVALRARNPRYRTHDDVLGVEVRIVPTEDVFRVNDLRLYLPYLETDPIDGRQRYEYTTILLDDSGAISERTENHMEFTASRR